MRDRREHRLYGIGRRACLVTVAAGLVTMALAVVLTGSASAAACVESATTDVYSPGIYSPTGGDWSTAADWSLLAPPSGTETACWNAGITVVVSTAESVDSIQADGALEITGGSLTIAASSSIGSLLLTGGDLDGASGQTLTDVGAFSWSGGAINAATGDALAIDQTGAATFSISGSTASSFDGGSITTAQPVSITSTAFTTANAPTLTTSSAITLGASVDISGSGATFTATDVTPTTPKRRQTQTQTYGFGTDALVLTGETTTVPSGDTLEAGELTLTGGTLDGQGTVAGAVTNTSGTVSPGNPLGVLKVTGAYSQGGRGTLAIDLDGTAAGTGFSQLQVGGATSLGGDVSLADATGFVPEPGETFEILSSTGSVAGLMTLTGTGAGSFTAQYDPNDVTLDVNPTPGNTVPPAVIGTLSVGQTLSCSEGTWSAFPNKFTYQWNLDGSPIPGATSSTYVVIAADQGQSLTCTVTASNSLGAGEPATSTAVSVGEPNTPGVVVGSASCPSPTGRLTGVSLGALKLGFTRAHARHALTQYTAAAANVDEFCLDGGGGIHAGYPSNKLLRTLSKKERARVKGRIVLALTMNPYYALEGARPGMKLTSVPKRLHLHEVLRAGGNDWYMAPDGASEGVLKVRGGIIQEIGIANKALTDGRAAQTRFLASFSGA